MDDTIATLNTITDEELRVTLMTLELLKRGAKGTPAEPVFQAAIWAALVEEERREVS